MLRDYISLARPEQWIKNSILFAAPVFAGVIEEMDRVENTILAVAVFCLLSSAVYTFNDIIDRDKDRLHPLKKNRPVAAGRIKTGAAFGFMLVPLTLGGLGAYWLNLNFMIAAGCFVALNLLYSLALKNLVILDAMGVAISFVIRAFAGAAAVEVEASKWMLINTLLLALFISFGKRRHELVKLEGEASSHRKILDKYSPYLLDQCIGVTTASVVVVYMLYTFSPEVSTKLQTENLYLTIPFVVYGVFRYLYLIHHEIRGGSPTRLLISDRPILLTVILWLIASFVILYLK